MGRPDVRLLTPHRTLLAMAGVALAADAASKTAAVAVLPGRAPVQVLGPLWQLRYIRNLGAAFGVAPRATAVLTTVAVGVVAIGILVAARRPTSTRWSVGLGLVFGGALGNLTDRLLRDTIVGRGAVVDWITLPHCPTPLR